MKKSAILATVLAVSFGGAQMAVAQGTTTAPSGGATGTPISPSTAPGSTTTPGSTTAPGVTPMTPGSSTAAPAVSGTSSATNNSVNTAPANNPGAPVAGANSFTEGQARDRIQDRGFSQVTDLKLDSQGIWRGKAMKGGQSVDVSMDYQGNIVPQ